MAKTVHPGLVSADLVDMHVFNSSNTTVYNTEPSLTRQEFADECDINVIMAQYDKNGVVSHMNPREPMYVDLSGVPNFREAMDMMISADKAFMSLPAKVRKEFDNDARKFVDFASDEANLEQMREWGLAPAAEPADDLPAPGVKPEPKAPANEPAPAPKPA